MISLYQFTHTLSKNITEKFLAIKTHTLKLKLAFLIKYPVVSIRCGKTFLIFKVHLCV